MNWNGLMSRLERIGAMQWMPTRVFLKRKYKRIMKKSLDLSNPIAFTEKLQALKIVYKKSENLNLYTKLTDKVLVKDLVSKSIGPEYIIPTIGVWNNFSDINFDILPNKFVLKTNHDSGGIVICRDKSTFDKANAKKKLEKSIHRNFYWYGREAQYKYIKKKIIAEEYIEELSGGLYDYKIHCFSGKPLFIQCIGERNFKNHTGYQKNYDLNWNELDWVFEDYPKFPYNVPKPKHLEEMINVATKLSEKFKYVRVDLYDLEEKVLFGEMTFTPGNGIYPYKGTWTLKKDQELGELIHLGQY